MAFLLLLKSGSSLICRYSDKRLSHAHQRYRVGGRYFEKFKRERNMAKKRYKIYKETWDGTKYVEYTDKPPVSWGCMVLSIIAVICFCISQCSATKNGGSVLQSLQNLPTVVQQDSIADAHH